MFIGDVVFGTNDVGDVRERQFLPLFFFFFFVDDDDTLYPLFLSVCRDFATQRLSTNNGNLSKRVDILPGI